MPKQTSIFKCPVCESPTKVFDTRGIRRRRVCLNDDCKHRFSTVVIETIVESGVKTKNLGSLPLLGTENFAVPEKERIKPELKSKKETATKPVSVSQAKKRRAVTRRKIEDYMDDHPSYGERWGDDLLSAL